MASLYSPTAQIAPPRAGTMPAREHELCNYLFSCRAALVTHARGAAEFIVCTGERCSG